MKIELKLKNDYMTHTEVYGVPPLTAKSLIAAAEVFHPIDQGLLL